MTKCIYHYIILLYNGIYIWSLWVVNVGHVGATMDHERLGLAPVASRN